MNILWYHLICKCCDRILLIHGLVRARVSSPTLQEEESLKTLWPPHNCRVRGPHALSYYTGLYEPVFLALFIIITLYKPVFLALLVIITCLTAPRCGTVDMAAGHSPWSLGIDPRCLHCLVQKKTKKTCFNFSKLETIVILWIILTL